ncbi:hypothetical protein CRG98_032171 [Punica granatum]|uniref:Uncharacterized protein n=1 Tax=Punica granatum TaxID=22663 RepID=A0A2I0IUT5_PUNGR|nr:hypothetical protein CRG98_032171 [Punica granatum]
MGPLGLCENPREPKVQSIYSEVVRRELPYPNLSRLELETEKSDRAGDGLNSADRPNGHWVTGKRVRSADELGRAHGIWVAEESWAVEGSWAAEGSGCAARSEPNLEWAEPVRERTTGKDERREEGRTPAGGSRLWVPRRPRERVRETVASTTWAAPCSGRASQGLGQLGSGGFRVFSVRDFRFNHRKSEELRGGNGGVLFRVVSRVDWGGKTRVSRRDWASIFTLHPQGEPTRGRRKPRGRERDSGRGSVKGKRAVP